VIRRNIRKQSFHQRADGPGQELNQAGLFGEAHDAEPKRHHSNQLQSDLDCFPGALDSFLRDVVDLIGESANDHGAEDQPKPNVIEHSLKYEITRRVPRSFVNQPFSATTARIMRQLRTASEQVLA